MLNKHLQKFFALSIVVLFSLFILYMLYPYLIPVFLGFTVAYLFYPFYIYLHKKTTSRTTSASLIIITTLLIVLIPLSIITGVVYNQITQTTIDLENVKLIENKINDLLNTNFSLAQTANSIKDTFISNIQNYSQRFVSITSSVLLSLFIFYFTLFYALIEHRRFTDIVIKYLPFSTKNSTHVLTQSGFAIKALLIGQVLTAIIQGVLGMFSFIVAGVEGAFFWGIVMIILSLIPVVGAFLVWVPAGAFLLFDGHFGAGIFVLLWGALVVSQIDNIIRPKLVNRFFKLHPLLIILGVFAGLSIFGMAGLIIGPLFLALFILLLQTYEKEYGSIQKN